MERIPREMLIGKLIDEERAQLTALTKERLVEILVSREASLLEGLSDSSLSNRAAFLLHGKYGVAYK